MHIYIYTYILKNPIYHYISIRIYTHVYLGFSPRPSGEGYVKIPSSTRLDVDHSSTPAAAPLAIATNLSVSQIIDIWTSTIIYIILYTYDIYMYRPTKFYPYVSTISSSMFFPYMSTNTTIFKTALIHNFKSLRGLCVH